MLAVPGRGYLGHRRRHLCHDHGRRGHNLGHVFDQDHQCSEYQLSQVARSLWLAGPVSIKDPLPVSLEATIPSSSVVSTPVRRRLLRASAPPAPLPIAPPWQPLVPHLAIRLTPCGVNNIVLPPRYYFAATYPCGHPRGATIAAAVPRPCPWRRAALSPPRHSPPLLRSDVPSTAVQAVHRSLRPFRGHVHSPFTAACPLQHTPAAVSVGRQ